jgi:hypothetical protein
LIHKGQAFLTINHPLPQVVLTRANHAGA